MNSKTQPMMSDKSKSRSLEVDDETSRRMSRIRTENTKPKIAVRRILHGIGFRYTTGNGDLPGSPDVANRSRGWVVFVHGCFWHAHAECEKGTTLPKRNREFWRQKFRKNRERDGRAVTKLTEMGIKPLIIWECELEDPESVARFLQTELSKVY